MSSRARGSRFLSAGLLASLALVAASVGSFHAEAKRAHAGKTKPPVDSADCKRDADCVTVADDCCPCAQGGTQRAIPKKDRTSYEKDRHKRCEGTMCTEAVSQDPSCSQRAFCGAGICELRDAPADGAP